MWNATVSVLCVAMYPCASEAADVWLQQFHDGKQQVEDRDELRDTGHAGVIERDKIDSCALFLAEPWVMNAVVTYAAVANVAVANSSYTFSYTKNIAYCESRAKTNK